MLTEPDGIIPVLYMKLKLGGALYSCPQEVRANQSAGPYFWFLLQE